MATKNDILKAELTNEIKARREAGLISGGQSFETKLEPGTYTGNATGLFNIIEFTFKRGSNVGKNGFMVLLQVEYEGVTETMPINDNEVDLYNEGQDVTFIVKPDDAGYKRCSVVKAVADTNVNKNTNEEKQNEILAKIDALTEKLNGTTNAGMKTRYTNEIAKLEKELELVS
jgi:hypothetical protein